MIGALASPPFAPVAGDLERLEERLRASLAEDGEAGKAVAGLLAGGKRLRPALLLLCARLGPAYEFGRVAPAAEAIELAHVATLIHDDVIDSSATRRGVPTLSAQHGDGTAIVVADYYFARSYREASAAAPVLVPWLAATIMDMCSGELRQAALRRRYRIAREEYMRRIELKTARLFALSCRAGALLGGLDRDAQARLAEFGLELGLAFQIADDVLDYSASEQELGKPAGHDLLEGHATLPLMLALERPAVAARLEGLLVEGAALDPEAAEQALALVRQAGTGEAALEVARLHARKARGLVADFGGSAEKAALVEMTDYVVARHG